MADLGILEVKIVPDMGGFASQVTASMASVASGLGKVGKQVVGDLARAGASLTAGAAIAVGGLAALGIKTAASLETATLQFQTLLGSADEAKAKVQDLFDFAKRTPFESGPVIEAARRLEIFGGAALDTQDNLTRVGDAAASVSAPIEDVAFWVGRAFNQIQAGKPFGEAAMRLQELGVMSGDTANKMTDMAAAGAAPAEVFKVLTDQMDSFSGAMDRQQNTLEGLTSTIKDQTSIGMARAFEPAFQSLKQFLGILRDIGDNDEVFNAITDNLAALVSLIIGPLQPAMDALSEAVNNLTASDIDAFFARIVSQGAGVIDFASQLYDAFKPIAPILLGVAAGFATIAFDAIPVVGLLVPKISPLTGAILGFTTGIDKNREALAKFAREMGGAVSEALPRLKGAVQDISDTMSDVFVGVLDSITPALSYLTTSLLPTLADAFAKVARPLGDLVVSFYGLASGIVLNLGPTFEAIATGVAAILSAGLGLLASLIGTLADHAALVAPALAGVAAAIAAIKFTAWLSEMKGIGGVIDTVVLKLLYMKENITGLSFKKLEDGASGASQAIGAAGLAGSLTALGIGLAVTVGVALLTQHFQKQKQEAEEDAARVDQLAESIRQYGDSAKTAADFATQLAGGDIKSDWEDQLTTIRRVVGDQQLLGEAIRGNSDAMDEVQSRLQAYADGLTSTSEASKEVSNQTFGIATAQQTANQQAVDAEGVYNNLNSALQGTAEDYGRGAQKASEYKTEEEKAKEATDQHRASLEALRYELDQNFNTQLGLQRAQTGYQQGLLQVRDALAAAKGNTTGLTKESLAARSAMEQQAQKAMDLVGALVAQGTSSKDATTIGFGLRDQLIKTMTQYGMTRGAAEKYVDQLGLTPKAITTQANFNKRQAENDAESYKGNLKKIPKEVNTTAHFDTRDAESKADQLEIRYRQLMGHARAAGSGATTGSGRGQSGLRLVPQVQGVPLMPPATSGLTFGPQALGAGDAALRPRVYSPSVYGAPSGTTPTPEGNVAAAAVVIREANFNEAADFDTLLNRVNLALAAGRL